MTENANRIQNFSQILHPTILHPTIPYRQSQNFFKLIEKELNSEQQQRKKSENRNDIKMRFLTSQLCKENVNNHKNVNENNNIGVNNIQCKRAMLIIQSMITRIIIITFIVITIFLLLIMIIIINKYNINKVAHFLNHHIESRFT